MKLQLGFFFSISILPFWSGVLGGQIPEINSVLGDISAPGTVGQQEVSESVNLRTPGKLRHGGVVEKSGVCGWVVPSLLHNSVCNVF